MKPHAPLNDWIRQESIPLAVDSPAALSAAIAQMLAALGDAVEMLGLRGCGFFRVVDGNIVFQRGYWDKSTFLRQHGLPLPKE
jgi:hypothetical protein